MSFYMDANTERLDDIMKDIFGSSISDLAKGLEVEVDRVSLGQAISALKNNKYLTATDRQGRVYQYEDGLVEVEINKDGDVVSSKNANLTEELLDEKFALDKLKEWSDVDWLDIVCMIEDGQFPDGLRIKTPTGDHVGVTKNEFNNLALSQIQDYNWQELI